MTHKPTHPAVNSYKGYTPFEAHSEIISNAIKRGEITYRPQPGAKSTRRGRPQAPIPENILALVNEWKGQKTLKELCQKHGISLNTLRYWLYTRKELKKDNK